MLSYQPDCRLVPANDNDRRCEIIPEINDSVFYNAPITKNVSIRLFRNDPDLTQSRILSEAIAIM